MPLPDYAGLLRLSEPWPRPAPLAPDRVGPAVRELVAWLRAEPGARIPPLPPQPRLQLRALLNVRAPGALPAEVAGLLDRLLWHERLAEGVVTPDRLTPPAGGDPRLTVWRGDVVRLAADAVVNAANSRLLGCMAPLHLCIDNAIHSAAGPRLRDDCAALIAHQGQPLPVGRAVMTRGYNLPARFVLHTVGPVVTGAPGAADRAALAACYRHCLELAAAMPQIDTLAFCCISTGVFGYPADAAATLAVATVTGWLDTHPDRFSRVIFNVFLADDEVRYRRLLAG